MFSVTLRVRRILCSPAAPSVLLSSAMIAQRFSAPAPARLSARSRVALRVQAFGDSHSTGQFKEGQKVKVVRPITLYSVPKHPEGLAIEGMEGEVAKDVSVYKGKVLSASLPYVVKFVKELEGKPVKFQAHLVRSHSDSLVAPLSLCPVQHSLCMPAHCMLVLRATQGEDEIAAV